MKHGLIRGALITAAVIASAACSSGSPATPSSTTTTATTPAPVSPKAAASPAQPGTAAAAKAAAARFFGLYNAGQYAAAWTLLPPATRRAIPQATWVAVHGACPSGAAGLAFRITDVTVTGSTAVVTYQLSGAGAALGSAEQAFTYSGGQWWLALDDPAIYRHGSAKADIAAAKASGNCATG
jgi:hypothetical protein